MKDAVKNGKSIFYGSSVRMGHKVHIFPILLAHKEKLREHEPRLLGGEAAPHSYSGGTLGPFRTRSNPTLVQP